MSYLVNIAPPDLVLIVLGDHQPASIVSGAAATFEVPVHVISNRDGLLQTLMADGFQPGLTPKRPGLGPMHALTEKLLKAFDGP